VVRTASAGEWTGRNCRTEKEERMTVNVAVIGAGRIGRVHAENLAYRVPNAHLAGIADVVLPAAQRLAVDLHVARATADYHELLRDPAVNAVVICSSTDTHAQIMEECAAAGKHIFCEKPIALDLARIDAALAAVRKGGVKLQVGFNRRYDPTFRRARDLVATGAIGEPHLLRITSRDPAPPPIDYIKKSGGIFLDMTIHDFDIARFVMGSEVEEIFCAANVLVDPAIGEAGDMDTAVITLRFANGALGVIDNSRQAAYGYDQRVEVFGSKGVAMSSNKTPDLITHSDDTGVHSALPLHFFVERYAEAYALEMSEFVQCIATDTAPSVSGADARIPVVMGLAAGISCRENRPVRLSEVKGA
jgi:myo-inositol 2-dehydrogenase/D-chiro-inositol 1-dehydrogenase